MSQSPTDARDFFVDALADPQLAPRAAVQLVQLGESQIPSVRSILAQAASSGTRISDVYWALSEIYLDDIRHIEENVRLGRLAAAPPPAIPAEAADPGPPQPIYTSYAEGSEQNIRYRLLSSDSAVPRLVGFVAPYYPDELLQQKLAGEVTIDIQITQDGDVNGLWLVAATPDIFGSLATAAVREWKFDSTLAKIRVIVEFAP
jgi:TonB family protein